MSITVTKVQIYSIIQQKKLTNRIEILFNALFKALDSLFFFFPFFGIEKKKKKLTILG